MGIFCTLDLLHQIRTSSGVGLETLFYEIVFLKQFRTHTLFQNNTSPNAHFYLTRVFRFILHGFNMSKHTQHLHNTINNTFIDYLHD